jgi:hypothetical protein
VLVIKPNGGETFTEGTPDTIRWTATDSVGVTSISIYYSTNSGGTYPYTVATGEANDGVYLWSIPYTPSAICKVKVVAYDAATNQGYDVSNSVFTIEAAEYAGEDPHPAVVRQELTELFNRKSKNYAKPVDSLVVGAWFQSEKVVFADSIYGTEIWKLSNDPYSTRQHISVNRSPWNCDGSLMAVQSARNSPHHVYDGGFRWYVIDGDGGRLRQIWPLGTSVPSDLVEHNLVAAWNAINPNYIYWGHDAGLWRTNTANSDSSVVEEELGNVDERKIIMGNVSRDNKVMVCEVGHVWPVDTTYFPIYYMVDLNKAHGDSGRLIYYDINFHLRDYQSPTTPHDTLDEYRVHDVMFMGGFHDQWEICYSDVAPCGGYCDNTCCVDAGGGEGITFQIPYSGNADSITVAFAGEDYVYPYYSHPFFSPDNRRVIYYGENSVGGNVWGIQLRDQLTQTPIRVLTPTGTANGGHTAWDGYDSTLVFAVPDQDTWSGLLLKANTEVAESAVPIAAPNSRINGCVGDCSEWYASYPRPAQSPDATKCFFASTMLQTTDNRQDCYIAVVRKPDSPKCLHITTHMPVTDVHLAWNAPPLHKEISKYHVYRSVADTSHFVQMDASSITTTTYNDTVSAPHVYYYAVTSEEYSGLESDTLSNIFRVTMSGTPDTLSYAPEGKAHWDVLAPEAPTGLVVASISGHKNRLKWSLPTDVDKHYCNIYFSIAGPPSADQHRRIASLPVSTSTFLDWQADSTHTGYYGVTVVDRQGNESTIAH